MAYTITAANKGYTGVTAGISFVRGIAENVSEVPDYFGRHNGYTVAENKPAKAASSAATTGKAK